MHVTGPGRWHGSCCASAP